MGSFVISDCESGLVKSLEVCLSTSPSTGQAAPTGPPLARAQDSGQPLTQCGHRVTARTSARPACLNNYITNTPCEDYSKQRHWQHSSGGYRIICKLEPFQKEPDNSIKQKDVKYSLHNTARDPHISAAQLI